jgi:hypothetical protein
MENNLNILYLKIPLTLDSALMGCLIKIISCI